MTQLKNKLTKTELMETVGGTTVWRGDIWKTQRFPVPGKLPHKIGKF